MPSLEGQGSLICPAGYLAYPVVVENMWHCNGVHPHGYGGEWQGHVLPGCLFILWSLHWMQGSMRAYFSARAKGVPFQSKACYGLPGTPKWPLESYIVVVLTAIAATLELCFHNEGYARLMCSSEFVRAGHFDGSHLNNWQHAVMYFCFIMAALATIISYHAGLPAGTDKVFFALAFLGEGMLMGLHEKHDPLNQIVHQALALSMLAACIATAGEVIWPHSYLVTCSKVAAVLWQGVMFCVVAQILYCGGTTWDQSPTDTVPSQYAAVAIVQSICAVIGGYVAVFMACNSLFERELPRREIEDL
mmetsp:Transcript_7370/g.19700  ORF Transcript_7370/g.19700 Transcript_7370/m.19700 type:complete len:304 (+) Transcript_7370:113-1024(+)|eukprot:CAMPEP_0202360590 /NCGR_PEP_ID=MMETSP1126-20121109/13472_1 /ASSEMBLY_ACC=CAM_ASM_000457 /TAXON_ID=3047 /ORGANISM="Dunaliella tertiolecta, Strain CCMP1320" /LENGTH=303 /DNA_ID=CAMNT_0048954333 /DNA_START=70 /DNA_END=981 /DNA_ORIENTATION=+